MDRMVYRRVSDDMSNRFPSFRGARQQILFSKCLPDDEDLACSWAQALIMYLNLEASIFGIRLPLINKQVIIGSKFWEVFQEVCAKGNIFFSRQLLLAGKHEISGYALLKNEEFKLEETNYTKTVYKVQVDELIYVGESSIRSAGGRDSKFAIISALRGQKYKTIQALIDRQNEKGLSFNEIPVDVIAVTTAAKTSSFYVETIAFLSYMTAIQFLMKTDMVLVNKMQSTCFLKPSWFEELQIVTFKLFGETVEIKGRELMAFENTFLHKFGLKEGGN